jgi:hypothetical protein
VCSPARWDGLGHGVFPFGEARGRADQCARAPCRESQRRSHGHVHTSQDRARAASTVTGYARLPARARGTLSTSVAAVGLPTRADALAAVPLPLILRHAASWARLLGHAAPTSDRKIRQNTTGRWQIACRQPSAASPAAKSASR